MATRSIRELAYLFVDNEMEPELMVTFSQRIEQCPITARETRNARRFLTVVRERCGRQPAPIQLRQRVLAIFPHRRPQQQQ